MVPVLLAFVASGCWGVADFGGGLFSRRFSAFAVLFVVEGTGLLAAAAIVLGAGDGLPSARTVVLSLAAGLAGVSGLALFYRALAVGSMSVVAPISSTGAAVPVVVGLATGDALTAVVAAGLALAFVGVVLAGREAGDGALVVATGRGVLLSLGAALGFGTFFVIYDGAADGSVAWAILISRLAALPLLAAVIRTRKLALPRGGDLLRLGAFAQLDCVATALYAIAITRGELSIVAVVGSLYPVATVLLARGVLGERMGRMQAVGVAVALTGVALVSAGSA